MSERKERLKAAISLHRRPLLLGVGAVVGFVAILTVQLQPPDPESRLPDQYRLTALIQRQQSDNETQRMEVERLRSEIDDLRSRAGAQRDGIKTQDGEIADESVVAGLTPVRGMGFVVTLNDSSLDSAPTGNVNDLVIHSQDVQAVVNGLWAAGAEAISINGQRVVSTSAVLCVGNTLLINGTVHAPPYEISAVSADRSLYMADPLVSQFSKDAERFSLGYSVGRPQNIEIPGYTGTIRPKYASKKIED